VAQQLEQKFQEGRQRGLTEAVAISRRDAEAQLQPVLERLARAIADLGAARQTVQEQTAADLVRLSITIASRILHREITLDPAAIHGLLKAAFDKTRSREVTRVLVHPAHEAAVRSFVEKAAGPAPIEIVADPRLGCGAIRLETAQGQLDASIDTQLKEIERGLADRMDH
jgi:flagellar assembly protein FliH